MKPPSPTKKNFKEKIVICYNAIFSSDDVSVNYPNIWNEIFLLKVNVTYLEQLVNGKSVDELMQMKDNLNKLFCKCCDMLKEDYQIKIVNALQTLCILLKCIFKKKFSDFGYDVINLLIGFDEAEDVMQRLLDSCGSILLGDYSVSLKNMVHKLLLVIATAVDNVSSNTLLEYFMMNSFFNTITQILGDPSLRSEHGHEVILLLCILINYRKHETQNPYIISLSILDDELALNGLGLVISEILSRCNRKFALKRRKEEPSGGLLTSITSFVGSMFVSTETTTISPSSENDAILVALYESVLTNRNFFTVLGHVMSHDKANIGIVSPCIERTAPVLANDPLEESTMDETQSGNLMATFLRFSSISIQDSKSLHGADTARLCLTILNCVVEDQYANAFLHDANMTFTVPIYKMNLYHRQLGLEIPSAKPLACVLLDLMVEFSVTHLMKQFPLILYRRCIGIIYRCLCYQKKCRIRLQYDWKSLWTALINILKFLTNNESYLVTIFKHNIFELAIQVVNIFNLFITYGDTFLPSPCSYDDLYYEIIRVHNVFDNLYTLALRYIASESDMKATATKLGSCLVNVRAIIHHFSPKIDAWTQEHNKSSLSEEEVLEVIRGNYETLTLKLMESLDSYAKYCEHPNETPFFAKLIRKIVQRVRESINISDLQQENILKEFSTIS